MIMNRAANESRFHELGAFGGECFRALCKTAGATWFHQLYRRYYCSTCANDINETRARQGEVPACVQHL
jgi:hypothetical protein